VATKAVRGVVALASGGIAVLACSGLARLALAFAEASSPRLALRWSTALAAASTLVPLAIGTVSGAFVVRALSGPALMKRFGVSLLGLGILIAVAGVLLWMMPLPSPVHPGRMAAADVAGGAIASLVAAAGAALFVTGALVALAAVVWSRTRHHVARGAAAALD
jgi:hypothetical protein